MRGLKDATTRVRTQLRSSDAGVKNTILTTEQIAMKITSTFLLGQKMSIGAYLNNSNNLKAVFIK